MSNASSFKPDQRLSALMRRPGGVSIADALVRAEQRVNAVRGACVSALDQKIETLASAFEKGAPTASIYSLASEIYSLATTFGLKELAEAAASLCDLLVNHRKPEAAQGAPSPLAAFMSVHIDALRTLRRPDLSGDPAALAAVVEGLRRVAAKGKGGEGGGEG